MSTDQQSTARQDLGLAEAGIEDPVVFEEDPGTSSRLHPLQRPKSGELLTYARPGDTVHISEMFRLVRGNQHTYDFPQDLLDAQLALHPRRHAAATAGPARSAECRWQLPSLRRFAERGAVL
ncbi:recombinase family protein [Streptomyces microflavus]|uniref:recombinase family protein n=1 Tax=Streptomyces microflavus TaxID=1919 RepID=UPI0035E07C60